MGKEDNIVRMRKNKFPCYEFTTRTASLFILYFFECFYYIYQP